MPHAARVLFGIRRIAIVIRVGLLFGYKARQNPWWGLMPDIQTGARSTPMALDFPEARGYVDMTRPR